MSSKPQPLKQAVVLGPTILELNNRLRRALISSQQNAIKAIKQVLEAGANPNIEMGYPGRRGISALGRIAMRGDVDVADLLIKHGANVNYQNRVHPNHTVLMKAIIQGHANMVELLLNRGANPDTPSHQGITPLMMAVQTNNIAVVRLLLMAGADMEAMDFRGRTALDFADNDIRRMLVEAALPMQPPRVKSAKKTT